MSRRRPPVGTSPDPARRTRPSRGCVARAIGSARESGWWWIRPAWMLSRSAPEDHQWIHRAGAATPFGGPIAHGFLTLSLLPALCRDVLPKHAWVGPRDQLRVQQGTVRLTRGGGRARTRGGRAGAREGARAAGAGRGDGHQDHGGDRGERETSPGRGVGHQAIRRRGDMTAPPVTRLERARGLIQYEGRYTLADSPNFFFLLRVTLTHSNPLTTPKARRDRVNGIYAARAKRHPAGILVPRARPRPSARPPASP